MEIKLCKLCLSAARKSLQKQHELYDRLKQQLDLDITSRGKVEQLKATAKIVEHKQMTKKQDSSIFKALLHQRKQIIQSMRQ